MAALVAKAVATLAAANQVEIEGACAGGFSNDPLMEPLYRAAPIVLHELRAIEIDTSESQGE